MTTLRTTFLTAFLVLTALPAAADGLIIDLPRLEFPGGADVTRGCTDPVATNGTCAPVPN